MQFMRDEGHRAQRGIVDACVSHYSAFSMAQGALLKIREGSSDAIESTSRLSSALSKLTELSSDISDTSTSWRTERLLAMTAASHSGKVIELSDAPQTLEVCLQLEAYHEALLVIEHCRSLSVDMPKSRLVTAILGRVSKVLCDSIDHVVLPRLSSTMPLTTCIKLITLLRRLGVEESWIRRAFLEQKSIMMSSWILDLEKSHQSPYSRMARSIGAFKVAMSDVIVQFEASFSGEDAYYDLCLWASEQSNNFRHASCVSDVSSGAELASLYNQIEVLSSPLGRVGVDLSFMFSESIVRRVLEIFKQQLSVALESYSAAITTHVWSQISIAPKVASDADGVPMILLHFLPLCYLQNGVLSALNEIRKCPLRQIASDCHDYLDDVLHAAVIEIVTLKKQQFFSEGERKNIDKFSELFRDVLVPYSAQSFAKMFSNYADADLFPLSRFYASSFE